MIADDPDGSKPGHALIVAPPKSGEVGFVKLTGSIAKGLQGLFRG